jgi:hypothetical protein
MEILQIQAILNINGIEFVIWVHTQWPIELSELYKTTDVLTQHTLIQ